MLSKLFLFTSQDDKYKIGQIWEYKTRKGEEKSMLTIVGVEKHKKLGTIVNIYVDGLTVKIPSADEGHSNEIQHLPFSKEAIDKSVTKLVGTAKKLPNYKNGYDEWRSEFDNGKAGIFTITVKESIDAMETAINHGTRVE